MKIAENNLKTVNQKILINTYTLYFESNSTTLIQLLSNCLFPSRFVFLKYFRTQHHTNVFLISHETDVVDRKEHWEESQLHRTRTIILRRAPSCSMTSFELVMKCIDILATILRIYFIPT